MKSTFCLTEPQKFTKKNLKSSQLDGEIHRRHIIRKRALIQLRTLPNFNQMTPEEIEEPLAELDFPETAKERIRHSYKRKNDAYDEISTTKDIHLAKKHCAEFHTYIHKNKIFLGDPLKNEFVNASGMIWICILDREFGIEDKDHKMKSEASKKFFREITGIMNNIEILVQRRLKYEKAD